MTMGKRMVAFFAAAAFLGTGAMAERRLTLEEMKARLDAIIDTEFCGDALADGMGVRAMLRGLAPTERHGFAPIDESVWETVFLGMMDDEINRCAREGGAQVRVLREANEERRKADVASHPERRDYYDGACFRARMDMAAVVARLGRMVPLLWNADSTREDVMAMWKRLWKECPPEYDLYSLATQAWVEKNMELGNFDRCMEMGRWYRAHGGVDADRHVVFCRWFCPCLKQLDENQLKIAARYFLSVADDIQNLGTARSLDMELEEFLPGWRGSIQRRRLAVRFPDEPIPRHRYWHSDTKEIVEGEIDEHRLPQMLNRRAAAELAADESELTDLREVYGDWTKDGEEE